MSRKILVADDSDNIRNVLQLNFEWKGYEVLAVADGEEAIQMARRIRPDLIILDIMMPRKNGYQVCRLFKSDATTADIPVILLTAKNQKEDKFWGRDCGADEYITKPFNTPSLERVVERLLQRAAEPDEVSIEGDSPDLEEALGHAVREGQACAVSTFSLEPKSLMVHRQKYGEIRHRQIFDLVGAAIAEVMREECQQVIAEEVEDGFRVLIDATAERARRIEELIVERADAGMVECYEDDDRERGYVTRRDVRNGEEVRIPLVTLQVEKTQLYNQD